MDQIISHWVTGFSVAASPVNLLFAFIGCIIGTVVGVLPGLGPSAATAILIPLTFGMDPVPAIIMLAAIYYGTQFGGTITSVLVNIPGESATVITCLDGHPLAKQGRAGAALGVAAAGSLIGGIVGTIALMALAVPLATVALSFGPPEIFALLLLGLTLIAAFRGKSLLATAIVTLFGLLLAMVGVSEVQGIPRFTFGTPALFDGIGLIPVVMGLFGIGELLLALERPVNAVSRAPLNSLLPSRKEWKRSLGAIGRGTVSGFMMGLVPGLAGIVPTSVAYALEKKLSKHSERFGRGAIEGVAVAETTNNSYAQGTMVPLLTLGIPGTATLAVLMGAFTIHGITPGPFLFRDHPEVAWPVVASFLIGNIMLFILNAPLVGVWAKILEIPPKYLYAGILLFCVIGAYTVRESVFDVGLLVAFGLLGYALRKIGWPLVPMVVPLVIAPIMERALGASLRLSGGHISIFLSRPVTAGLLGIALLVVVGSSLAPVVRRRGTEAQRHNEGALARDTEEATQSD